MVNTLLPEINRELPWELANLMVDVFITDFDKKRSVHLSPFLVSDRQIEGNAESIIALTREDVERELNQARQSERPPNFMGNNLQGSNLRELDLTHAIMVDTDLRGANLQETVLDEVDFRRAKFQGADLRNARLRHANFHNASYDKYTVWPTGFEPLEKAMRLTS